MGAFVSVAWRGFGGSLPMKTMKREAFGGAAGSPLCAIPGAWASASGCEGTAWAAVASTGTEAFLDLFFLDLDFDFFSLPGVASVDGAGSAACGVGSGAVDGVETFVISAEVSSAASSLSVSDFDFDFFVFFVVGSLRVSSATAESGAAAVLPSATLRFWLGFDSCFVSARGSYGWPSGTACSSSLRSAVFLFFLDLGVFSPSCGNSAGASVAESWAVVFLFLDFDFFSPSSDDLLLRFRGFVAESSVSCDMLYANVGRDWLLQAMQTTRGVCADDMYLDKVLKSDYCEVIYNKCKFLTNGSTVPSLSF